MYIDNQQRKKYYQRIVGSAPYCRTMSDAAFQIGARATVHRKRPVHHFRTS